MSMKLNIEGECRRDDVIRIDPNELIVNPEKRGRWQAPDEAAVLRKAVSMLERGQLQPVWARRLPDKRLELILGFTRVEAAKLIRSGFTDPETGEFHQESGFLVTVKPTICNEDEALKKNIDENLHRDDTSPMDDAHNQERLRTILGYSNSDIARAYGHAGDGRVAKLQKLLALPRNIQAEVHAKTLSVDAALDLLDLDTDAERQQVVKEATENKTGRVSTAKVRQKVRQKVVPDEPEETRPVPEPSANGSSAQAAPPTEPFPKKETPGKPAAKPRTLKEVKDFWKGQADSDDEVVARFAREFLEFAAGIRGDKGMVSALRCLRSSLV